MRRVRSAPLVLLPALPPAALSPFAPSRARPLTRAVVLSLVALTGALAAAARPVPAQDRGALRDAALDSAYAAKARGDTAAATAAFRRALAIDTSALVPRLELAYLAIAAREPAAAVPWLREVLERAPGRVTVRRQLGYVLAELGRADQATTEFRAIVSRGDSVRAGDALSLGYLLAQAGRVAGARDAFGDAVARAEATGEGAVADEARAALGRLGSTGDALFAEAYVAPFYQTRFENGVAFGFLRAGIESGAAWSPAVYLSLRVTRDTRSVGGQQPQLFTDNAAIGALGVRVRPANGPLWLYGEVGAARLLVADGDSTWRRDVRAGAYVIWDAQQALRDGGRWRHFTSVASDVSWYERFDRNVIGYAQLRDGVRLRWGGDGSLDLFARGWIGWDGNGDFFNRVGEAGGGMALRFPGGATALVEAVRGRFLDGDSPTEGRSFNDLRVSLVFGTRAAAPLRRGAP